VHIIVRLLILSEEKQHNVFLSYFRFVIVNFEESNNVETVFVYCDGAVCV